MWGLIIIKCTEINPLKSFSLFKHNNVRSLSKKLISESFRKLKISDISETNLNEFTLVHSLFLGRHISNFYKKSENLDYYWKYKILDYYQKFEN